VEVTTANTLVLLASSAVMLAATRRLARVPRGTLARRLGLSALLGGLFLTIQGYEWTRLIAFGLTVSSGIYGALFYTLIGAHAVHVLAGLAWLTVTAALVNRGQFASGRIDAVRACSLYWHFVVALWPLLYASVYLP
jgi:heme/copper-type cytochrome/quinol oxidase subunit 3